MKPLQKMGNDPQVLENTIIGIAKNQGGYFSVTPRYRDYPIADACERLKKKKVFKQTGYGVYKQFKLIQL